MKRNMEVLLWKMIGDKGSNQDVLEYNGSKHYNALQNVIGVNKLDWGGKERNGSQREGFAMKYYGRW